MLNHTKKNPHVIYYCSVTSDYKGVFLSMSKPFDNNLTNVHSIAGGAFKIQMLKSINPLISTSFLLQQSSDIKV